MPEHPDDKNSPNQEINRQHQLPLIEHRPMNAETWHKYININIGKITQKRKKKRSKINEEEVPG